MKHHAHHWATSAKMECLQMKLEWKYAREQALKEAIRMKPTYDVLDALGKLPEVP